MEDLRGIFDAITERFEMPIRIGGRCESDVYYRVEDLGSRDIEACAKFVGERIRKVCYPTRPELLISLRGSYTGLATELSTQLARDGEPMEVIEFDQVSAGNGIGSRVKNANVILVNDVITTARSSLEAHTRVTVMGGSILCWAALIDRTFGPGPVPVVAAFTGAPVTLLDGIL